LAEGNEIHGFTNVGITLLDSSSPELSRNTISNEETMVGVGISMLGTSNSHIHDNNLNGLEVCIGAGDQVVATIENNSLESCYQAGISFANDAAGVIRGNTIAADGYAIIVSSPAHPEITGNNLWGVSGGIGAEPESWLNQLIISDNQITSGPPEVTISTFTPTP